MFGFSIRRLNKAKQELEKVNRAKDLARETLKVEGQIAIGRKQISLMESTQKKLVNAEIKGMEAGLKKTLPVLLEARQQAGQAQISGYLDSVKQRASSK
jgi:hypothetical protein